MLSVYKNFVPLLFSLAVFTLIWRYGFPKPFEILISLTLLAVLLGISEDSRGRKLISNLMSTLNKYRNLIAVLLVSTFAGTLFSVSSFNPLPYMEEVYVEYVRIIFSILLFFLTIYVVNRYQGSTKLILGAVALSPVVLLLAFNSDLQEFFVENSRLVGARNDPNYLATFIGLGILIGVFYFFYTRTKYRWLGLLVMIYSAPLFLWTGSRGAFLSLVITYIFVGVMYLAKRASFAQIGALFLTFILSFSLLFTSFFILPDGAQALIYERTFEVVGLDSLGIYDTRVDDFGDTLFYSRSGLWKEGFSMAAYAPLGFGPAYHNFNPVGVIGRPHSLWLEVLLTAGWMGLVVWVGMIYFVGKEAFRLISRGGFVETSLTAGFIYLLINGFFLDMFTLRWLWLIMGMIVGYSYLKDHEKTKSISTASNA